MLLPKVPRDKTGSARWPDFSRDFFDVALDYRMKEGRGFYLGRSIAGRVHASQYTRLLSCIRRPADAKRWYMDGLTSPIISCKPPHWPTATWRGRCRA